MAEQYLPRFAGDALPTTGVGTALALAAVRANRLALLARVRQLFLCVADLSRLPG